MLLDAGASGIFFAPLQWTSLRVCSAQTYQAFAQPYDLEVLNAVQDARFNMLHVCGDDIDMARFYDYPVDVLNWDNFGEGNPSLAEAAHASGKVVAGGIPHKKLHKLDSSGLSTIAQQARVGVDTKLILAGGCGIGATTPDGCRRAVTNLKLN